MKYKSPGQSNPFALLPFIIFIAIYLGAGLYFQAAGVSMAFYQFPSVTAMFIAVLSAFCLSRDPVMYKFGIFSRGAGNDNIMTMLMIYILAGAFSAVAAAMGGRDATVNLGMSLIPPQYLTVGIFLISAFMGTATGTSMGTVAAIIPIAAGMAEKSGLPAPLLLGACVSGAMFGDNLSMISDTTIAAAEGCGSKMKDKFRMNFSIALPAALVSLVLYYLVSGQVNGAIQVGDYNFLQIVPYIFVLVLALMGVNVALVLFGGILMTGVIGVSQGTVDIFTWAKGLGSGMEDMFSISIVAILVSGIIALVRYYGGVEWMVAQITRRIHGRKGAEYGIGLLSGLLSAAMVNNTIAIIVTCPIARVVGGKYNIAPKRLASLVDIFACSFLCIMPHDGGMLIVTQLAGTSPLDVMQYCYYVFALLIATCITIQFGTHENK